MILLLIRQAVWQKRVGKSPEHHAMGGRDSVKGVAARDTSSQQAAKPRGSTSNKAFLNTIWLIWSIILVPRESEVSTSCRLHLTELGTSLI
jgi:hypothetical protein